MSLSDKEMIEARCQQEGFAIQSWSVTDDGETAALGQFTVTTPDYEDTGLYENDQGELTACVVGAEKYNNRQVSFSLTLEGFDMGTNVEDLSALDPA